MLVLLSPAKKLSSAPDIVEGISFSEPSLLGMTYSLVERMKRYGEKELSELMGISAKLASLNFHRYQNFENSVETPSIYLFRGDTYSGFDVDSIAIDSLEFANQHVRILSGLYGILRPYDNIKEYRLEMGTRFKNYDLYQYWSKKITEHIVESLLGHEMGNFVLNLASQEYAKVVDRKELARQGFDWLDFVFYDRVSNGESKVVGLLAKKARGRFARFISDHKLDTLEKLEFLKRGEVDGYSYQSSSSDSARWVFSRS